MLQPQTSCRCALVVGFAGCQALVWGFSGLFLQEACPVLAAGLNSCLRPPPLPEMCLDYCKNCGDLVPNQTSACRGGAGVHSSCGGGRCGRHCVCGRRQVPLGSHHDCQPSYPRVQVVHLSPLAVWDHFEGMKSIRHLSLPMRPILEVPALSQRFLHVCQLNPFWTLLPT